MRCVFQSFMAFMFYLYAISVSGQPTNDNCSFTNAYTLVPVTTATSCNAVNWNTYGATQTYAPSYCAPYLSYYAFDVFFKFTAAQSSYIVRVTPSQGYV